MCKLHSVVLFIGNNLMVVLMNNKQRKGRKILFIATSILLLSVVGILGFNDNNDAFAKKPQKTQAVANWSNGFPNGEHANLNIHGKKLDPFFNCDNSQAAEPFGKSIFVKLTETDAYPGPSKIEFVSNKRATGFDILKVLDPCAAPFGQDNPTDAALIQLEAKEMQVYWRILGKPNNGSNGPSTAMLAYPRLIEACNFLPIEFADDSKVNSFHPDAQANGGTGLVLIAFNDNEEYVDVNSSGDFDAGDSIYRDSDNDNFLDGDDDLLYGLPILPLDNTVALKEFDPTEQHEDDTGTIGGQFDGLETVYLSVDALVSEGDTRLANASSQGLPESEGGDAIDCSEDTLVGLGLINNKGVFDLKDKTLERFEDPEPVKGKGKSKAVDITGLFKWTGVLCDALSAADLDMNGEITLEEHVLAGLTEAIILATVDDATQQFLWPISPHAEPGDHTTNADFNGMISEKEFAAYLAFVYPDCFAFFNEWIFTIADIVRYGLDYINDGTILTQMRFYPVATTEFS